MKANVQKALSVVVAAIGLALLVMMVVVEGEPGAIPLALILAGVVGKLDVFTPAIWASIS